MFFRDKVHIHEVVKWGIFAGVLEGLYIALATILYGQRGIIESVASGWEHSASFFLLLLIVVSAIVTTIIVFAHPIYSLMRRHYRDALLTIVVTLITVVISAVLVLFAYQAFTIK